MIVCIRSGFSNLRSQRVICDHPQPHTLLLLHASGDLVYHEHMPDSRTNETLRAATAKADGQSRTRNGVPLLPARPGVPRVTPELVRQLEEELR
jgi:hypothetical protein